MGRIKYEKIRWGTYTTVLAANGFSSLRKALLSSSNSSPCSCHSSYALICDGRTPFPLPFVLPVFRVPELDTSPVTVESASPEDDAPSVPPTQRNQHQNQKVSDSNGKTHPLTTKHPLPRSRPTFDRNNRCGGCPRRRQNLLLLL